MTTGWNDDVARGDRFKFGDNWLDFAESLTEPQIARAVEDLKRLLRLDTLDGRSFLDIGSGSGLSALAALRMGAARVLALDYDPDSVACSEQTLSRHAPAGARYEVMRDSILRDGLPAELGSFDVVYAWGSLHHTGQMDKAIRNAASLCAEGSEARLALALYRRTLICPLWSVIKKLYISGGPGRQAALRRAYLGVFDLAALATGRASTRRRRLDQGEARGMSFEHDVHDWLGGYPYESISPRNCRALLEKIGFSLAYQAVRSEGPTLVHGCDEYLFLRAG